MDDKAGSHPGGLETLLTRDGVQLQGEGEEKMCRCFSPSHDDSSPSMSVNVATSKYYCHGCGIKGDAITYLREFRGMSLDEAKDQMVALGWTDDRIKLSEQDADAEARRKQGKTAKHYAMPRQILSSRNGDERGKEIARYEYRTVNGILVGMKNRYAPTPPFTAKDIPKTLPWSPCSQGGWWNTVPDSKTIPEVDRWKGKLPLYRLPELVKKLQPKVQIWIVEGEKAVDSVMASEGFPEGGPPPVTCVWGGFERHPDRHDLTPLEGRKILMVADTDAVGIEKFSKLGYHLQDKLNCAVKVVFPEGEGGYDVADAIAEGGFQKALEWIKGIGVAQLPERKPSETIDALFDDVRDSDDIAKAMERNPWFRILGISDGMVAIRKNNTMEILRYAPNQFSQPNTFIRLADLEFWIDLAAPKAFSNNYRMLLTNEILRLAEKKGMVDLTRAVLGRGGFMHHGRAHFYLGGSKVVSANGDGKLTKDEDINALGQVLRPGPEIIIKPDPSAKTWGRELYATMMDYRWATDIDGEIFLGWVVTSLIGGLLPFRPMVWIVAPASTGKTFLSSPVLKNLLGESLWIAGDQTAAAIIEHMKDDSLPIWIDEFEPGVGRRDDRFRDILALIRLATSGDAEYARGGPAKQANAQPRFSAICSSINQASMSLADETRFVTIRLHRKGLDMEQWKELEARIRQVSTRERGQAIQQRIIENAASLVELTHTKVNILRSEPNIDTRQAQIYGALSAGVSFLADERILLKPRRILSGEEDEWRPFEVLMSTPLPFTGGSGPITLAEAVAELQRMSGSGDRKRWDRELLHEFLERYGVRWQITDTSEALLIAHTSEGIKMVFKHTEFANLNVAKYLLGLPGVQRETTRIKFGAKRHACVAFPISVLHDEGFFDE